MRLWRWARSYRESMRQMATMSNLEVWYFHVDVADVVAALESQAATSGSKTQAHMAATATKARGEGADEGQHEGARQVDRTSSTASAASSTTLRSSSRSRSSSPRWSTSRSRRLFRDMLRRYRQSLSTDRRHLLEEYRFSQMARKVVGVGSVGTRAWVILLHGASHEDVLFLQAKEAEASVLERFTKKSRLRQPRRPGGGRPAAHAGQQRHLPRLAAGRRHRRTRPHDYYVRQLQDWKGSIDTDNMVPEGLEAYGKLCALTLARAHARSGDRFAMAAYLGNSTTFEKALAKFAESYADQNERDYEAFAAACKSGRLARRRGALGRRTWKSSRPRLGGRLGSGVSFTPVAWMCDA